MEVTVGDKEEAFCDRFAPIISRIVSFAKAIEGFEDIPHEDQVQCKCKNKMCPLEFPSTYINCFF